jgi:hypothetical protein
VTPARLELANLQFRKPMLCPVELRGLNYLYSVIESLYLEYSVPGYRLDMATALPDVQYGVYYQQRLG